MRRGLGFVVWRPRVYFEELLRFQTAHFTSLSPTNTVADQFSSDVFPHKDGREIPLFPPTITFTPHLLVRPISLISSALIPILIRKLPSRVSSTYASKVLELTAGGSRPKATHFSVWELFALSVVTRVNVFAHNGSLAAVFSMASIAARPIPLPCKAVDT